MKESKIIIIISLSLLFFCFPFSYYLYLNNMNYYYDLAIGIITGVLLSLITSICQYFIMRKRIINDIFDAYFDMFKVIELSVKKKKFIHYNVYSIYKQLKIFSNVLSKNLSAFSGFVPNKINPLYQTMNKVFEFDEEVFNLKNILKMIYPDNRESFNKIVIPFKNHIKNILIEIDEKKFITEYENFIKINNILGIIEK